MTRGVVTVRLSTDCVRCPQFRRCGQYALVLSLDNARGRSLDEARGRLLELMDAGRERTNALTPAVRYA